MATPFLTDEQVNAAREELKKIFKLAAEGHAVEMFSTAVDAVWHDLLSNKEAYERFSIDACGSIIGHSSTSGEGFISFVKKYEDVHGKFPEIWFTNRNGIFDSARYKQYRNTGVVISGWDCTPTHNCAVVAIPK